MRPPKPSLLLFAILWFLESVSGKKRSSTAPDFLKYKHGKKMDYHEGQLNRFKRSNPMSFGGHFLKEKIQKKRNITMVSLGGSNTAGGGLYPTEKRYFELVQDWWNTEPVQSKMNAYSMAITGTGSDFFMFCFQNFLLDNISPDIVILEFAINDGGNKYGGAAQPMELLTRKLLLLPSKPLILYVNLVNPDMAFGKVTNRKCSNMEDMGFDELAKHYQIQSFSMRNEVCPLINNKRTLDESSIAMFANDGSHTSGLGHKKIASMITRYLKNHILQHQSTRLFDKRSMNLQKTIPLPIEPVFTDKSIDDCTLKNTLCWSHMTNNWKIPLQQSLDVQVNKSRGLRYRSPEQAKWEGNIRTDAPSGWEARSETIQFAVKFMIPSGPKRSLAVIFQIRNEPLSIKVYLNDKVKSCINLVIKESSGSTVTQTRIFPVAQELLPGTYYCFIEGNVKWLNVVGLTAGYQGFNGFKHYKPFEGSISKC